MQSIKQKSPPPAAPGGLPNFRNLGVLLRLLLLVNVLAAGTAVIRTDTVDGHIREMLVMAAWVELPLFLAALGLYLAQPWLARQRRLVATAVVFALVGTIAWAVHPVLAASGGEATVHIGRWLTWAFAATAIALIYFDYRTRLLSTALTEARLMALTARIRPHFLFNSLNGVLGVIRTDPRRAEHALEELADLFRVLMRENRELVPLAQELALCEGYLELERLRLGERLQVRWETAHCPRDALVPPLLLQPLLENAVYHGIEPAAEAGEIVVRLYRRGQELRLEVENPIADAERHEAGNRMALDNIRERLMLFFDLEAGLDIVATNGRYRVRIRLPYRSSGQ